MVYVLNAFRLGNAFCLAMSFVLECLSSWMPFVLDAFRLGGPRVPVAPNAGPQAPPIAGATKERRLLAVACRPMLGAVLAGTLKIG